MRLRPRREERHQFVVSVNNRRCHRYGICVMEAANVFALAEDGRLQFDAQPPNEEQEPARMAARMCPMQAIIIEESRESG